MRKPPKPSLYLAALTTLFAGSALAQQAPAPSTPPAATQQAPASTTPKTPAAKPKTSTAQKTAPAPLALKTQKEKFSYALGMNLGTGLKKQEVEVDPAILARGFRDAFGGGKTALTEDEARTVLTAAQAELRKKQQEKQQAESATNKKTGEEFLAANKAKDGVITLPSGLQYKVLTEGTGPKPSATDSVLCNYKGTLIDGTEFDSSYKRGQPATIPVSGVIKAWTEALQMMPVGSKWELFVPAELGYGERQAGPQIGPNSTLIFEVELLSIQPKEPPKAAPVGPGDLKDDKTPPPGAAPTPKPNR